MKNPIRITIALDSETNSLLEKIKEETKISQSELVREALRFYHDNKKFADTAVKNKLDFYMDMLLSGEHIILDVDHWLLFLGLVESSPEKEQFWEKCRDVARSHAEQLRHKVCSLEDLLERLEACNFFRTTKNSENDFTLVLGSEITKKFVKTFIEEFLSVIGLEAEIKENITKIRITTSKF
jgi:predicted transcriptional regulator